MVLLLKLLYFYCFTRLSRYNFLFRYYSRLFCIPMSVFYNMETFILPRGLLIMYSSSLSFQKTPIFHTGGYFLEFVLLLLLLITGFIYIYVNLRSTEKPRKMIKIKKITTHSAKSTVKIGNSPKINTEKSVVKLTSTNKKRFLSMASYSSIDNPNFGSSKKKCSKIVQQSRMKNENQRSINGKRKSAINQSAKESNSILEFKEIAPNPTELCESKDIMMNSAEQPRKIFKMKTKTAEEEDENENVFAEEEVDNIHMEDRDDNAFVEDEYENIFEEDEYEDVVEEEHQDVPECPTYTIDEKLFIYCMEHFVIKEHLLIEYGFPCGIHWKHKNYGIFFNATKMHQKLEPRDLIDMKFAKHKIQNERQCCRCKKNFVFTETEQCCYHSGKLLFVYGKGYVFSCCQQAKYSEGCCEARDHVSNGLVSGMNGPIEGFIFSTSAPNHLKKHSVVALDCEMCFTISGLELTRATLVDFHGKVIYDTLVQPHNPIIDYNTSFSGITKEDMEMPGATKTLKEVQEDLLRLIGPSTIIVGHGLENDLRTLKMIHTRVIDTAIIFSNDSREPFFKRHSLKNLSRWYLKKEIERNKNGGHDSIQDAKACLELLKYKVRNDWRDLSHTFRCT